jgi:hypothetical protein
VAHWGWACCPRAHYHVPRGGPRTRRCRPRSRRGVPVLGDAIEEPIELRHIVRQAIKPRRTLRGHLRASRISYPLPRWRLRARRHEDVPAGRRFACELASGEADRATAIIARWLCQLALCARRRLRSVVASHTLRGAARGELLSSVPIASTRPANRREARRRNRRFSCRWVVRACPG